MEMFWIVIASVGAGVGTGLAGLSAATVMVPMMIVLCPSFSGYEGAFQATAIALASDVLGSAVTSFIYIRHRNIDLKKGWIMLVCILSMCTVGSLVAWYAGNVVLGGFTLFLTLCIGIRFLIKPDTQRNNTVNKEASLSWQGVCISLFFGLTIGFGTGFVGTGGGMMMLVVFTAFLGMERKVAVGTSTFIMTFTALIAALSHFLINPAMLTDHWQILLTCICITTISSIITAQFANRVNNKTVGYVTGAILTVLGLTMILLNYWQFLTNEAALIHETLEGLGMFVLFIGSCAIILLIVHHCANLPKELFRKLLHIPAFCSSIFVIYTTDNWLAAALILVLFAVLVYPALCILERWKGFSSLFNQRRTGEVKKSLLYLFLTQAVLVALCWGVFGLPYIVVTATLMWGLGDAMAALVGKRYGKHHFHLKHADHNKTWEGSLAMLATAFIVGVSTLVITTTLPWYLCLVSVLCIAPFTALTELYSHNGNDTITVPVITAMLLLLATLLY